MNGFARFLISILFILLACGTSLALSMDGGGTWDYSRDIVIQDNSSNPLKNYSVLVELEDDNFPTEAQEDGADIRFTDEDGNELDYWIENFAFSTKKAKLWVKIPYIPANKASIFSNISSLIVPPIFFAISLILIFCKLIGTIEI